MMNKPYGASPLQRQRELDAFEEQRQAYNTAMRDYEEANQQPVANFDAGGEVRKMYLEQTGREADPGGLDYFVTRFGDDGKIDPDELDAFRTMAGQEVINNDIRKAAAAEQAAAATAADAVARQQATAAAAAKKVTDIAAGTAGMEAAAGSVAAGQLAAINQAGATTGQSPAEQQAAVVRQLTAQMVAAGQSPADFYASGGKLPLTAAIANDLMLRSMTTGASTAEFDRYGGYKAVRAFYDKAGGSYNLNDVPAATLTALAQTIAKTGVGDLELLKKTGVPLSTTGYQNMIKNGIDPASAAVYVQRYGAASPLTNLAGTNLTSTGLTGTNLTGTGSTGTGSAGVTPIDYSSILTAKPLTFNTSTRKGRTGTLGQTSAATDYTSKGVGTVGDASTVAAKGVSKPLFGQRPVRRGAAGNPSNYFAYAPETLTGLAPGTVALGSVDMPLAGGKTTLKALESAPNLSPGMLGGVENAMYRTDRLGNRIYAPATKSLFGFAKGGDVDLQALLAQNNETLSDDTSEESINTDPLGSAQKMMADFSSASQANPNVSPVRKAIKQTKPAPAKSGSAKMAYESLVKGDLGAMGTAAPALKDTDSAQAQMQELARIYRLKAQASQERARGLSANTFGAPTLGQPTLTKGKLTSKLTSKRFNKGGEAKKPEGEAAEPLQSPEEQPVTEESSASRALGAFILRLKEGAQGYLGLDPGISGSDSYRTGQALSNMPGVGAPGKAAGAFMGMIGPTGIIKAARRSKLFKDKGMTVPDEKFSSSEMLKMLEGQGIDTSRMWLRGKKEDPSKALPQMDYDLLEYLYSSQKRPNAVEAAMRDSRGSQASAGRTLSRQPGDRAATKFNTKGGVWLTESPSIAQTYSGDKGFTIPVYAPKPDVVVDAKGEQWSDFYSKDKDWKTAFGDPKVRLIEVRNVIDAGPHWSSMIPPDASEDELRKLLTATNLFAKKPFDKRVVNKMTGEPYEFKQGGPVKRAGGPADKNITFIKAHR